MGNSSSFRTGDITTRQIISDKISKPTDLKLHELNSVPSYVYTYTHLVSLCLHGVFRGGIEKINESIGNLVNLEKLTIRSCDYLQKIPNSIGKLQKLKELEITYCALVTLPESIGELVNLEILR
jgi:hypothetical protein